MCRACTYEAGCLGRGGVTRKDSRMKYPETATAFSIAPYRVSRLFCPQCHDLIIAATKSQHVSTTEVHHWWACEACGYEFRTTVRWQSSFVQSLSTTDSAMA
jgi:RNase P subunit RPR2